MRTGSKTNTEREREREQVLRTIVCMWEDKNLLFYSTFPEANPTQESEEKREVQVNQELLS